MTTEQGHTVSDVDSTGAAPCPVTGRAQVLPSLADRVAASCTASGVPIKLTDPRVLARIVPAFRASRGGGQRG